MIHQFTWSDILDLCVACYSALCPASYSFFFFYCYHISCNVLSFMTGNKPPGLVPNKFSFMTKDLNHLAQYFNVPLQTPSDPFEAMFQKGTDQLTPFDRL